MLVKRCRQCGVELSTTIEGKGYHEEWVDGPCTKCPRLSEPEEKLLRAIFGQS